MRMKRSIKITLRKNLKISVKPKNSLLSKRIIFFSLCLFISIFNLKAQINGVKPDSLTTLQNRTNSINTELAAKNDTLPGIQDSVKVVVNGIETTIKYYAKDSIINKTQTNITYLYGDAKIEYGLINLRAAEITINRNNNELRARGVQDSTGLWVGRPIFKDPGGIYETEEIRYNFVTQRARIKGVATEQPDGLLRGEVIKRNADETAYISEGKYIPCLDDPDAGTFIKAKKIKLIPDKGVITGPFLLYVGGIPTPLGLPFGFFPDTDDSKESGILFPKYGDEQRRGIFLREGGWYQAWNDRFHTALTGDIYSKGSWGLKLRTAYNSRYKYSGSLDISYNRNKTPDTDEVPLDSKDFWVSWSHRPDSKGRNSRFSASVTAGTSTYNQNNLSTVNFQNNVRSEFRSNVNFSGVIPRSPFSYAISGRHNQNVQTGVLDISLPEFSMTMNRVTPFKGAKQEVLKRLNLGWRFNASNRITNVVQPGSTGFNIANKATANDTIAVTFASLPDLLDNAKNGARHNFDLSTSFSFLDNLTFTPSFNVEELWYLEELNYEFLPDENAVRIDTINAFSRAMTYNTSMGLSTQIYGMIPFKNSRKIEAIRHIITPTVAFTYRPDFSDPKFGFYQTVQTDTTGTGTFRQLSIYDGFRFGSPSLSESAALSFSVSNKLEMKVKSDTAQSRKVSILDNLSMTGAYNFLADSFQLSNININARTSLFNKKLSIIIGGSLDPYSYITSTNEGVTSTERRAALALRSGQGLGKLTTARFSLSTNLNSKANSSMSQRGAASIGNESLSGLGDFPGEDPNEFGALNNGGNTAVPEYFYDPNSYVDINIPWNIRLSYDYNYRWSSSGATTRQTVRANGQLQLTPKWQVTYNTGFDFDVKEFVQTSIGLYRDLGCWEMRANWIPFGTFTSYTIDIQIKASALKDLKISRRRSQFDQGGFN